MSESKPPLKYLADCSEASLESFELSRLNQIANLRKELREVLDEWVEAEVQVRLARRILEDRRARDATPIAFLQRRLREKRLPPALRRVSGPVSKPRPTVRSQPHSVQSLQS